MSLGHVLTGGPPPRTVVHVVHTAHASVRERLSRPMYIVFEADQEVAGAAIPWSPSSGPLMRVRFRDAMASLDSAGSPVAGSTASEPSAEPPTAAGRVAEAGPFSKISAMLRLRRRALAASSTTVPLSK